MPTITTATTRGAIIVGGTSGSTYHSSGNIGSLESGVSDSIRPRELARPPTDATRALIIGTAPELQGGAAPITVDMELLTITSSSFAPTGAAAAGMALLGASATGADLSATEALTLALLAAAAAGQAPSAGSAAGLALQSAVAAAQAPSPAASTDMPLLSGGPGTQPPTPGASLDVPLQTTQLQLFDPVPEFGPSAITVEMPLLEALVFAPPMFADLEVPPPYSVGRARSGRTAPAAQPITVKMELLEIRATAEPLELGIWTVLLGASLEARLDLYDPEVTLTWPAEQMQAELERMLLGEEEDLLGIGI